MGETRTTTGPATNAGAQAEPRPAAPASPDQPEVPGGPPPAPPSAASAIGGSRASQTGSLIGATVSHYRILERLGGGGMGVVYKAWDLRLERFVALKFLSPHRSGSGDFKVRFAREARTASRLEHPNICTVFETDETADQRLFIAMAFCDGESLKRKIERGPLQLTQALSIGAQVAAGLAAAHDKGIVHRDVKPGNIMVAEDGKARIVDFGIARLADQTRLTRTGDVMGTTAYVAPEQFMAEDADHRADLWALGVVIYEMVTQRLPWSTSDERELVNAIVKKPARPLSVLRPGVPQAFERLVARALAKRPVDRYQRADEMAADLLAVAEMLAQPAPTYGPYDLTLVEAPLAASPNSKSRQSWQTIEPPDPAPAWPTAGGVSAAAPPPAPPASGDAVGGSGGAGGSGGSFAALRGTGTQPSSGAFGAFGAAGPASGGAAATDEPPADPASASRSTGGMIGRVISHYRILSTLGGGGMGVVYKAQDLRLERVVALKFLPPELTRDPDSKTRFLQEARAASALDHPNICTIHEVGETDEGQLYLAMACYDGETLKQRLQRGALPIDEALETAQQMARGLVKAHRHGIVHRDIKPANLMITSDEIVKILDFGIAKLAGAAGLTRTGSSLGTPGYMSPEQARGEEVDPRTDVWSLGAVLYEMVTGRRPFRGEHEQTVLYALFNEDPEPIPNLRPDVPPELVRIVGHMLAKDREQRYPTAAAALADLRALYGPVTGTGSYTGAFTGTSALPILARPTPPPLKRHRKALLAIGGLLLAVAVVGLWAFQRYPSAAPQPSHFVPLTDFAGKETFPALSPNGNVFAYVRYVAGRSHIFWQRVGGANSSDLSASGKSDDTQPAFSPDDQQIAFRSEREGGGIFVMGATGENVHRITNVGFNPAWSPNGTDIVYATEGTFDPSVRREVSELWRVPVSGGEKKRLPVRDGVQPSWSPSGRRIAYWGRNLGEDNQHSTIWTIPADDGGEPSVVWSDAYLNWNPVWSADGRYLYFASNRSGSMNFWRVAIDEVSGRLKSLPEMVTTPAKSSGFLTFSRDGHLMAYATDESKSNIEKIALYPRSGTVQGDLSAVTEGSRAVRTIEASPNGAWLVYSTTGSREDLVVASPDRSASRQLTNDNFKNRVPRWSPDSSSLAFYSNRGGLMQAWAIRPDGSDLRLLSNAREVFNPLWSPDSKLLACNVGLTAQALSLIDLGLPLAKRQPKALPTNGKHFYPFSWSLDGKRIVGMSDEDGIFVYSLSDHSLTRLSTDKIAYPSWLHDDRSILYVLGGSVMMLDGITHKPHQLLAPPQSSAFVAASPSPDGQVLYTVRATEEGDIWMGSFN